MRATLANPVPVPEYSERVCKRWKIVRGDVGKLFQLRVGASEVPSASSERRLDAPPTRNLVSQTVDHLPLVLVGLNVVQHEPGHGYQIGHAFWRVRDVEVVVEKLTGAQGHVQLSCQLRNQTDQERVAEEGRFATVRTPEHVRSRGTDGDRRDVVGSGDQRAGKLRFG